MGSARLHRQWWFGGGVLVGAGRAESEAISDASVGQPLVQTSRESQITYRTDFALGPMLELSYALGENEDGQWILSMFPGTLFTTGTEHSTLFVPFVIGHRWL